MADRSAIEWTDTTWNPVTGCTKISPGCDHCYASAFFERFRGVLGHPFEMGFDLTLRPERLLQPLGWKRPRMVFVNSMSDLFHKEDARPLHRGRVRHDGTGELAHIPGAHEAESILCGNSSTTATESDRGPHIWWACRVEDEKAATRIAHLRRQTRACASCQSSRF